MRPCFLTMWLAALWFTVAVNQSLASVVPDAEASSVLPNPSHAQPVAVSDLVQAAEQRTLARSPEWLPLLQYRPPIFGWTPISQADDDRFFLAPAGKTDPDAELSATLAAFMATTGDSDPAQCRFPARLHWLQQQGAPFTEIPTPPCPALEQWLQDLNTARVTLVFASSYLNSPSSMFGHTFLRLDPPDLDQGNPILASTISYAADAADHDSELLFAYRGIFGGYPGITTVEPYYDKIRLYSEIENRDLWEYQLNLAPDEVKQLLRHAWEIKDKRFDNFFLDENCAYRLLTLVDVARPGTELIPQLPALRAIPSDTVRVVVANQLVDDIFYRPSQATLVRSQLDQLSEDERTLAAHSFVAKAAPNHSELTQLAPERQAALLEATYQFTRYRALSDKLPRQETAGLSYALLQARSRTPTHSPLVPPAEPATRDDQGHATGRASLGFGRQVSRNFIELQLRPAYHDLQDAAPGYRPGSQLLFLNTDLRYYLDRDELQLERLDVVSILSLTPRDLFFQPLSWHAAFGSDRQLTDQGLRPLAGFVEGGAGYTYAAGGSLVYGLVTGAARVSKHLQDGFQLAPGATVGWSYQAASNAVQIDFASRFFPAQDHEPLHRLAGQWSLHWQSNWSLSIGLERERSGDVYATTAQTSVRVYF